MMAKCVKTIVDSMKEKNEYQYPQMYNNLKKDNPK